MSFAVHTFETGSGGNGFAFHENLGEGKELYFLGHFPQIDDAKSKAEMLFGSMVESFEHSKVADGYDQFEDALKAVNLEAEKTLASDKNIPEILIAFFDFNALHLSVCGGAEAYLVRGNNVSQISESLEGDGDLFLNILSGQVEIDDVILLSSQRILRTVTAQQLAELFLQHEFGEAVQVFRHELASKSDENLLVTAIGVGKKEKSLTSGAAGFLSKMVSGPKPAASKTPDLEGASDFEPAEETLTQNISKSKRILGQAGQILSRAKKLFQKEKSPEQRKNLMIIAMTIFAVFIVGIGIRGVLNYESADVQELRKDLSIAREALQQADTFLLQGERQSASEFLTNAESAVQKILNSDSKNFRSDAQFLLADIQEKKLQVENAKKVIAQILADLGVKNDNLEAVGLLPLKGNVFVHDLQNVFKTVRNIVEKGLPISEKETILASAVRPDQNTLLFLTDLPRIIEYREGLISPMGTADETWKRGIDLKTYGRYAYILDPVENQIWKYERQRDRYSPAIAYNQGADLGRGVSLSIDGSMYVLSDDGSITKLFRGERTDYDFKDLPSTEFSGKNLKLFTSENLDFLYVLDPDRSRILVFVKGDRFATYKKQVLFDVAGARDFFVDDSGQKASVLTADKIYEFSL